MTARTRWALLAGVVVVVLAGLLLWHGRRARQPADFHAAAIPIDSKDLALEVEEVRGQVRQGRTEWRCVLRCGESGGCNAQLLVTVHYLSGGRDRNVTLRGTVAAARGEDAVLGGTQRPAEPVDMVQRVRVIVEQRLRKDGSGSIAYE